jgi:hypothetical protein
MSFNKDNFTLIQSLHHEVHILQHSHLFHESPQIIGKQLSELEKRIRNLSFYPISECCAFACFLSFSSEQIAETRAEVWAYRQTSIDREIYIQQLLGLFGDIEYSSNLSIPEGQRNVSSSTPHHSEEFPETLLQPNQVSQNLVDLNSSTLGETSETSVPISRINRRTPPRESVLFRNTPPRINVSQTIRTRTSSLPFIGSPSLNSSNQSSQLHSASFSSSFSPLEDSVSVSSFSIQQQTPTQNNLSASPTRKKEGI